VNTVRVSSCCLAAIGIASAITAWRLGLWQAGAPGPGLFPLLAALMLFGTSIGAAMQRPGDLGGAEPADRTRLLRYALAMLAFAIAFGLLGVVLATFGFVVGVLRGIERLRWSQALAVAALLAALSWIVFRQLLGVPLPAGLLEVG
jgi:putative tricarboxylic transport membrane protein